jgi:hypothetical protein
MKRLILLVCLLCGLSAKAQPAIIGINTENPQGVLHIDVCGDPQTGAIPAAAATNDVVVAQEGRIGAGLLSPVSKIDLGYNSATTVRALSNYAGSLISPTSGGAINASAGSITLPQTDKYRVTVSIYWESNRTVPYVTQAILSMVELLR